MIKYLNRIKSKIFVLFPTTNSESALNDFQIPSKSWEQGGIGLCFLIFSNFTRSFLFSQNILQLGKIALWSQLSIRLILHLLRIKRYLALCSSHHLRCPKSQFIRCFSRYGVFGPSFRVSWERQLIGWNFFRYFIWWLGYEMCVQNKSIETFVDF